MISEHLLIKLYDFSGWVINLIYLNVIWTLLNIPTIFLTILLFMTIDHYYTVYILILLVITIPFILYPTTSVLFQLIRNLILKKNKNKKLFFLFLKYYWQDFITNIKRGSIISLFWVILFVDYYFYVKKFAITFETIFILLFILLFVYTLNHFSMSAHFKATILEELKNTFYLTIGKPLLSLRIGLTCVVLFYISVNYLTFLIPLILTSLTAFLSIQNVKSLLMILSVDKGREGEVFDE